MDPVSIIAIIMGGVGILGTGFGLFQRHKAKFADNAKITTIKGIKDTFDDVKAIWAESEDEIKELIYQAMALSKTVDKQAKAVDTIKKNDELRKALVETASGYGPEALEALDEALTAVPGKLPDLAGLDVDKLTKLKEAQRKGLSKKEAYNKVLGDSGKMAREIIKLGKHFLPKDVS